MAFKPYVIHAYKTFNHDTEKVVVAKSIEKAKELFLLEYPQYDRIVSVSQIDTDVVLESDYWEGSEKYTDRDMIDFAKWYSSTNINDEKKALKTWKALHNS